MPAFVPIVLGLGGLGLLALSFAGPSTSAVAAPAPLPPNPDPPPAPPPAPKPNTWPAGTVTAVVIAPHGVNVRSAPDERSSKVLAAVPQYERVAIVDSTSPPLAPTPAAPEGWWAVKTLSGVSGYATAQYLFFGSDAEARQSDADFQKQQQEHQNDEDPIFQGMHFGAMPRGSFAAHAFRSGPSGPIRSHDAAAMGPTGPGGPAHHAPGAMNVHSYANPYAARAAAMARFDTTLPVNESGYRAQGSPLHSIAAAQAPAPARPQPMSPAVSTNAMANAFRSNTAALFSGLPFAFGALPDLRSNVSLGSPRGQGMLRSVAAAQNFRQPSDSAPRGPTFAPGTFSRPVGTNPRSGMFHPATPAGIRDAVGRRRNDRRGIPYWGGYGYGYGYPIVVQTASTLLRCVAPSGCYLRVLSGGQLVASGIVVDNSAPVVALQRFAGPKTDPSSPSAGGWTRVRFSPRTGGTYEGYLPSEWLVAA